MEFGIHRDFTSAPTVDTERRAPFAASRNWNPSHIEIFGHSIDVDIPTGNLLILTSEVAYPYYNFSFGISRKYDAQEQHMQLSYLRNYTNVNPKPHWFGNWQFAYEADVNEVWHNTCPELHVTSSVGANGLFEIISPDFIRNISDGGSVNKLLRNYGIPGRTQAEIGWKFTENDFLLRTLRGPFQILTGHFQEESLVDDINAEIWLFNPISGSAFHITSEYFYNISGDKYRDVGYPLVVTKLVDALGHTIELKPSSGLPPFKEYTLGDMSGRKFQIQLNEESTFLDGLRSGREVRKYLVSEVTDATKLDHNVFAYKYNIKHLLEEVIFPSSIGNRHIRYHYKDPDNLGVLTAIEDSFGHQIKIEYMEDPLDNDERLNPRMKVKKITDPEGNAIEYEYSHDHSQVVVTVSQNGIVDRKVKYEYTQDKQNTKQRYITLTQIEVRRGLTLDALGIVSPIAVSNPQVIRQRTEFSMDGRFNITKIIDPLGRTSKYEYNQFNQIEKQWDIDNHWTKYTYDISSYHSATSPIRYDLLQTEQENLVRTVNAANQTVEVAQTIRTDYQYNKYDANTSSDPADLSAAGGFSTHRVEKTIDKRQKVWTYAYDDTNSFNPLAPTSIISPLGNITKKLYNDRGETVRVIDAELNVHLYSYYPQGVLKTYTDPNGGMIQLVYCPEANWLQKFFDQDYKLTEFRREVDGRIKTVIDPVGDSVDYAYFGNNRLQKVIHHRPVVPSSRQNPASGSIVTIYRNIETEFIYSSLGSLLEIKSPKGLQLTFDYDENGRLYQWYHKVPKAGVTKFIYDTAGQLLHKIDRKGQRIDYTYHNSGQPKTIQYPPWSDGVNVNPGKSIEYNNYDYNGHCFDLVDSEVPGNTEYVYDAAGNLVIRRDPGGFRLDFTFDDDNRLTQVKDPYGFYELTVTPDAIGRVKSLTDSAALDGSMKWDYTYQKVVGTLTKVLNLYKIDLAAIGLKSSYDYDPKNRIASIGHTWDGNPPVSIYSQQLHYDDDNLISNILGDDANSYRYDGLKQLVFEANGNLVNDYDEVGNRLYRADKTVNPNPHSNVYNQTNQLKKDENLSADFRYDKNGNLVWASYPWNATRYYFDGAGQLRLIKSNKYEIGYLYNHTGCLVQRIVKDRVAGSIIKTVFRFLFCRPIIVERDSVPISLLTWDASGNLLRIRMQQVIGTGAYGNSLFALYDGMRNLVRLVDDSRNEVVRLSYDPWGNMTLVDPGNLFDLWGYRNGLFDKISGNILFGTRWYSPKIARWISEDHLVGGGLRTEKYQAANNLYAYVNNSPVSFSDPSGQEKQQPELGMLAESAEMRYQEYRKIRQANLPRLMELVKEGREFFKSTPPEQLRQMRYDPRSRLNKYYMDYNSLALPIELSRLRWLEASEVVSRRQGVGTEAGGLFDWQEHVITGGAGTVAGLVLAAAGVTTGITEGAVLGFLGGLVIDVAYESLTND